MVAGKTARPDTSILMYQAIRRVLVECEAHGMPDPIPPLRRQDYDEARKLPIEWRSTKARSKLLRDLANDGRVLSAVDNARMTRDDGRQSRNWGQTIVKFQ